MWIPQLQKWILNWATLLPCQAICNSWGMSQSSTAEEWFWWVLAASTAICPTVQCPLGCQHQHMECFAKCGNRIWLIGSSLLASPLTTKRSPTVVVAGSPTADSISFDMILVIKPPLNPIKPPLNQVQSLLVCFFLLLVVIYLLGSWTYWPWSFFCGQAAASPK